AVSRFVAARRSTESEDTFHFYVRAVVGCVPGVAAGGPAAAAAAADALVPRLAARPADAPWRLHVLRVGDPAQQPGPRRAQLVEGALLAELKERRRRLLRARVPDPATPRAPGEAIVQLALSAPGAGFLSLAEGATAARLRRVLSRFPGGACGVPEDRRPPARAYRKLLEVEARWGRRIAPGETCADLGAAPGSWSWVALERGARVTAVDRAPLRADLMSHPALNFVRGDAFKWLPAEPVDWLLCDVIAEPRRSVELLARWLDARACRRFVLTVKFKGAGGDGALRELADVLQAAAGEHVVRHLDLNKNEVTAFGQLGSETGRLDC
ncbi:MAG TPA: SAM-dependent methyltransferase, partial [Planctomycetota bacterium]|nr:SAM-dependent methyltransferase [Planctomycetota bacterium]